ncbi:MAG TPA: 3-oxoadipate enol-lactonase [Pseudonocardia sp.]|jgi:3-oxoadipate enol-lactonase
MMGERSPVRLHCVEDGRSGGTGPPLLLVGSLGSTLAMWEPQVAAFGGDRRVIRVDHRGHGDSPVPAGPYTVAELAADVLTLLDHLGLDQVDYVGLSLGGMVGMYLGSEAPERINRLALLATSAHFPDPTPWIERIKAVSEGGTEVIAPVTVTRWFTPAFAQARPDWVARCQRMVRDTPDVGYLGCAQAIRDWDHVHRLAAITVPTLLVGGSADPSTPIDPHAETIAANVPGVRYEIVSAAHLLSIERAEEVNGLIAEHLAA